MFCPLQFRDILGKVVVRAACKQRGPSWTVASKSFKDLLVLRDWVAEVSASLQAASTLLCNSPRAFQRARVTTPESNLMRSVFSNPSTKVSAGILFGRTIYICRDHRLSSTDRFRGSLKAIPHFGINNVRSGRLGISQSEILECNHAASCSNVLTACRSFLNSLAGISNCI